mmetsp:Transcript_9829/g.59842  ORF Transcript_9829/g.59842 Transcript_9829/m.59842 type:complete len:278 (+) Transcript_9829:1237-2070(+)
MTRRCPFAVGRAHVLARHVHVVRPLVASRRIDGRPRTWLRPRARQGVRRRDAIVAFVPSTSCTHVSFRIASHRIAPHRRSTFVASSTSMRAWNETRWRRWDARSWTRIDATRHVRRRIRPHLRRPADVRQTHARTKSSWITSRGRSSIWNAACKPSGACWTRLRKRTRRSPKRGTNTRDVGITWKRCKPSTTCCRSARKRRTHVRSAWRTRWCCWKTSCDDCRRTRIAPSARTKPTRTRARPFDANERPCWCVCASSQRDVVERKIAKTSNSGREVP